MIYYGVIEFEIETDDLEVAKDAATNALAGVKSVSNVTFAELLPLEDMDGQV